MSPGLAEQQWDEKLPEPLSWRSDEEDEDSDFGEEQRDCCLKVLVFWWSSGGPRSAALRFTWPLVDEFS